MLDLSMRFLTIIFFSITLLYSEDDTPKNKYWVLLLDKNTPSNFDKIKLVKKLNMKTKFRREKVFNHDLTTFYDWPVNQEYLNDIQEIGVELLTISRWLNAVSIMGTERQQEEISNLPFVKKIKPVLSFRRPLTNSHPIINRSNRTREQPLEYGNSQEQIEQIGCDLAHDAGFTGDGIRILVMDTGFSLDHEVFDSLNVIAEWDFVNDDSNTENETEEEDQNSQHNHGTMVLSTIAGYSSGNLIGPAYNSEYLLAKTEMVAEEVQIEEDNYIAGLEWGESNGADIVSTSLGYLDWYTYEDMNGDVALTTIAIDIAVKLGMVCVTAAGNEGNSSWGYIIAPADADSVISVGAVRSNGTIASFSSHGPTYDGRIKPEVCARGSGTACANPSGNGYITSSGTSFAAPLVGGSAALILSVHPDWTPMMVREALMQTASQASAPDTNYGYGIINVWDAINYSSFDSAITPHIPLDYSLSDGYPNPFNSGVTLSLDLQTSGWLSTTIHDIEGREVELLFRQKMTAGKHQIVWAPRGHPAGVYFISLTDGFSTITKKITYLK